MKKFLISFFIVATIIVSFRTQLFAQENVHRLPNVEVDTVAFPAIRILKQLQKHEKEDRLETIKSFEVQTDGDYSFEFKASKFMRNYSKGMLSVFGFPRLAKLFTKNDYVSYKIHSLKKYQKGKLKDINVRLDSANIELTKKQYDLIVKDNIDIDDYILAQFRSPKQPWGSKEYDKFEWLLMDTLNMYGHCVDILQFRSRPSKNFQSRYIGTMVGTIWIIEDYWRVIGLERQNLKSRTAMNARLEEIAPGVFLPRDFSIVDDFQIDTKSILSSKDIDPESVNEKDKTKIEEKSRKFDATLCESYNLRMEYRNVETKE